MRAAVQVAGDQQPMPVHGGVFTQGVGDGDLGIVALVDPKRGT